MRIIVIPALQDNYIYLVVDEHGRGAVVDPGEATPLLKALAADNIDLQTILITHRHADHIGGLAALRTVYPAATVYAPAACDIAGAVTCADGDEITALPDMPPLRVIATPGHTREHVAYVGDDVLFCGDTLFIGGCGRVFDGTMQQMHDSLATLAALPDSTQLYCGHEYTLANLRFALMVEPENEAIKKRLRAAERARAAGNATVPGTLGEERAINPFLRLTVPDVAAAAARQAGGAMENSVAVFTALREWKNTV